MSNTNIQNEIYRIKYLKYKAKYIALTNEMHGGDYHSALIKANEARKEAIEQAQLIRKSITNSDEYKEVVKQAQQIKKSVVKSDAYKAVMSKEKQAGEQVLKIKEYVVNSDVFRAAEEIAKEADEKIGKLYNDVSTNIVNSDTYNIALKNFNIAKEYAIQIENNAHNIIKEAEEQTNKLSEYVINSDAYKVALLKINAIQESAKQMADNAIKDVYEKAKDLKREVEFRLKLQVILSQVPP
jgi:hypothetical protein